VFEALVLEHTEFTDMQLPGWMNPRSLTKRTTASCSERFLQHHQTCIPRLANYYQPLASPERAGTFFSWIVATDVQKGPVPGSRQYFERYETPTARWRVLKGKVSGKNYLGVQKYRRVARCRSKLKPNVTTSSKRQEGNGIRELKGRQVAGNGTRGLSWGNPAEASSPYIFVTSDCCT
jgi:hypothetical protein